MIPFTGTKVLELYTPVVKRGKFETFMIRARGFSHVFKS